MSLHRRSFLAWLGGFAAALGIGTRRFALVDPVLAAPPTSGDLDLAMIEAISEVVLPTELGRTALLEEARAFQHWIARYEPGAEIVHPYGNPELRRLPASPADRWQAQLSALDSQARDRFGKSFPALPKSDRDRLIRDAINGERLDRMGDPAGANHVVVAIAARYFSSSAAADLAYRSAIGRNTCRPLAASPAEPVPLRRGSGA